MYIKDDICYASKLEKDIRVTEVKVLKGMVLLVTFSTGEQRLFDPSVLTGSAFKPLSDEAIFNNPTIFHGVITWANGTIDIAPEMVYRTSYPYETDN